jgi:hypothetical protein
MEKATAASAVRQPPQAVEQAKTEHRWHSQPLTTPITKLEYTAKVAPVRGAFRCCLLRRGSSPSAL